ncbi:MAG: hypothetical protein J7M29_06725 [Verrucomicrobia bacterium]|nr:hypothetical protein [Verrucomicrobiota bacterium]
MAAMGQDLWEKAAADSADPERVKAGLERLRETPAALLLREASEEQARVAVATLSGSRALGVLLGAHPEWTADLMDLEDLRRNRRRESYISQMEAELGALLEREDFEGALRQLRTWKQRQLLRIAAKDLAGFGSLEAVTAELSHLADACLEGVLRIVRRRLAKRLGEPFHRDSEGAWRSTGFAVVGLGKLGGTELNYHSDVDIIFVYDEEGVLAKTPPSPGAEPRGAPSGEFFERLSGLLVSETTRAAPEGQLYRVDLRLRPDGPAGAAARSLASYEEYYGAWGQTWERMMLLKARRAAGSRATAGEFLDLIEPFRHPRSLDEAVLDDIADMKQRIEREILTSDTARRNIKLGPGGIREIEFVTQALQLLHAGKNPFVAEANTLKALGKLAAYRFLEPDEARFLQRAYVFLRAVEHRLQMEENRQTHELPTEEEALIRLARLMGFKSQKAFLGELEAVREKVRSVYGRFFPRHPSKRDSLPPLEDVSRWREILAAHSFRDPEHAWRLARRFIEGSGVGHASSRVEATARRLFSRLLELCPRRDRIDLYRREAGPDGAPKAKRLSDPDRVMARLDTYSERYGARRLLFESWNANPKRFEMLTLLFDRSEFLAEIALREPDMVDWLEEGGFLTRSKNAAETLAELRAGRKTEPDALAWVRRYHQAEFMRIGLRDILGLADYEQNLKELSALAEACLRYALEVAFGLDAEEEAPIAVIGLGKLGGAELNYGSDLDVLFVAEDEADLQALLTPARELIRLIAARTEYGVAFEVDTRLRPDGKEGLLVNHLRAHLRYYRERGRLWEVQALTRARFIAGNARTGRAFLEGIAPLADLSGPGRSPLWRKDWRIQVDEMRRRIERERTRPGRGHLAIKTGAGGIMDAEFIAQTYCLSAGKLIPNTLQALRSAEASGWLPADAGEKLIENYRKLRQVEAILRRWSYEGETELPDDEAALYRVAVRCGFAAAEDLLAALARYRAAIREAYNRVFSGR